MQGAIVKCNLDKFNISSLDAYLFLQEMLLAFFLVKLIPNFKFQIFVHLIYLA